MITRTALYRLYAADACRSSPGYVPSNPVEWILRWPWSRAREYERAHPGTRIYRGDFGEHYAWTEKPGDRLSGELTHGRTEEELLAKLAAPRWAAR